MTKDEAIGVLIAAAGEHLEHLEGELLRGAPEELEIRDRIVRVRAAIGTLSVPQFDRIAYQREYMRKRRAALKA